MLSSVHLGYILQLRKGYKYFNHLDEIMSNNDRKWFDSLFSEAIGIGGLILALAYSGKSCMSDYSEYDNKQMLMESGKTEPMILQRADLNGNGIPDLFYSIDGKVALIELDGNPVTKLYQP